MALKERLYRLVDELPDEYVPEAERALVNLQVPLEDEPVSEEEDRLVSEAWEDVEAGHVVSSEELDREFGW